MTEPIHDIHPRDTDQDTSKLLDEFSDLISETVNFGTHILKWDVEGATGNDENIPISMMLRHILELTDSVSILVKHSSIDPCKPLLRVVLETFLGLEYILEKDTQKRALGFLVWQSHKQLLLCQKMDPSDKSHSQFLQKLRADKSTISGISPPIIGNINDQIENFKKTLALPLYAEAEAEYQRIISTGGKVRTWYQLFSDIRNLEQLSNYLSRQALYEIPYRAWSGPTHGTDIIQSKLSVSDGGKAEIVQIRFIKDAQMVTNFAVTLAIFTYQVMSKNRMPKYKSKWAEWYASIRDSYLKLTGENLIVVK
jgi:hypothetical protein